MSIALRRLRDRVRIRIRDTDARKPSFGTIEIDQAMCDAYLALQAQLPPPTLHTPSAFTIAAGGDTFTLPVAATTGWTGNDGGAEYAAVLRIQVVSTGDFMQEQTREQIDAFRQGVVTPALHLAVPSLYCLWEEKDQTVQGRCRSGAKVAEACNLFRTMAADDLRDYVGAGTEDLDDVEVMLSRVASMALVLRTASEMVARMTGKQLELRDLNAAVVTKWEREADDLLYAEEGRRHDLEDSGAIQRWQA